MSPLPSLLLLVLLQTHPGVSSLPAPTPAVPPTRMGRELLASCPLVVVGRTITVRAAGPGIELLHVSIVERLVGSSRQPGEILSVLSPLGQFPFGSEDLLFLKPWRGEERFEVAQRVAATDPKFELKLALTRRMVWLMEIPDEQQRIDATLSLVLSQLRSTDGWTRTQGLDELNWMIERFPGLFTTARRTRIVSAGRAGADPQVVTGITTAMRRLAAMDAGLRETAAKEQSPP